MIIPLKPHDFNLMLNLVAHFLLHTLMFILCKIVFWKHDFNYNCEISVIIVKWWKLGFTILTEMKT